MNAHRMDKITTEFKTERTPNCKPIMSQIRLKVIFMRMKTTGCRIMKQIRIVERYLKKETNKQIFQIIKNTNQYKQYTNK